MTRREFLILLAGLVVAASPDLASARDGEGGGDDGGHDDGGHDNDGHDDDGGRDGDNGDRGKKRQDDELTQDQALAAREQGRVIALETALRIANAKVRGRVIDVELAMRTGAPQYRVKIRRSDGVIKTIRLDARTGRVLGSQGF